MREKAKVLLDIEKVLQANAKFLGGIASLFANRIFARAMQSSSGECSTFACKRRSFASDAMFLEATQYFCNCFQNFVIKI